jgi:hypothetical protein
MLESGTHSVQQVAQHCGFHDPERMRRSFVRLFGAPPSALKRAVRAAAAAQGAGATAPRSTHGGGRRAHPVPGQIGTGNASRPA